MMYIAHFSSYGIYMSQCLLLMAYQKLFMCLTMGASTGSEF